MAELLRLMAGSEVRCTDGRVGHVGGLIFDPHSAAVTHVSVATHSASQTGRLVPLEDVASAGPLVQLACARDAYYRLAENEEFVAPVGAGNNASVLHVHLVPHGETELTEGETIHAADGRAGHLVGVAVNAESHTVQELLARVGHFSGRREVSIPFDAVATIDKHGIHLRVSKDDLQ
jgi:sporulation protein YlmC with PRC-barrel domain